LVKDKFLFREIDSIIVKGRVTPLSIYELYSESKDNISENILLSLDKFQSGLKLYREMNFNGAIEIFKAALELNPDDQPSSVFLSRSQMYAVNPPPADWDGVFVMTRK
jgi:adenylate cyclase